MPAWSLGKAPRGKSSTTTPMTTPGPGTYGAITGANKAGPKWSLGKASRDSKYVEGSSPGPGAYEPRPKLEGPKYAIAGRHTQSISNLAPGPGQYNPEYKARLAATSFKYTMAGRPASAIQGSNAPGPGSYDLKMEREKGTRFGKDARKPLDQSYTMHVPGPGSYNPSSSEVKRAAAPRYTFGQKLNDSRAEPTKGTPGPGSYNAGSSIGTGGVKLTMTGRRPVTSSTYGSNAPGPGAYSPSMIRGGAPSYKVGTASRGKQDREAQLVPGPGAYNPAVKGSTPGWGMGTSKRDGMGHPTGVPGPGSYQQPPKLGEGPKYALRPRTAVIVRNEAPGPGQYSPDKNPTNARPPSAIMSKGQRGTGFGGARNVPGPGAYAPPVALKGAPAYSFGTATAVHHETNVPGPGAYKLPSTISDIPSYAMPQKSKEFQNI